MIVLFSKQVLYPFHHKTQNYSGFNTPQFLTQHGDSCFINDSETQFDKLHSDYD